MRACILIATLSWGCGGPGDVDRRSDGGTTAAPDAAIPDSGGDATGSGCESTTCPPDGAGSRFQLVCVNGQCVECQDDGDCTANPLALGERCSANRCICDAQDDCITNPNGPLCMGSPRFCGCAEGTDCPSGVCEPNSYVGGSICVLPDGG